MLWGTTGTLAKRTQPAWQYIAKVGGARTQKLEFGHQELQSERDKEGGGGLRPLCLDPGPTSDRGGLTWMLFSCRFK